MLKGVPQRQWGPKGTQGSPRGVPWALGDPFWGYWAIDKSLKNLMFYTVFATWGAYGGSLGSPWGHWGGQGVSGKDLWEPGRVLGGPGGVLGAPGGALGEVQGGPWGLLGIPFRTTGPS